MWRKRGLIYCPTGELWWARSYALLPTVDILNEQVLRIYFASLDEHKYGRIGYIDVEAENPQKILKVSQEPVLDLGDLGTFDDSGVNPACILNKEGKKYLYYIGWQRCERVPYMLFAGLAYSLDGVKFRKVKATPILDRTQAEPYIRSAMSIIKEEEKYKAWYVSAQKWVLIEQKLYPSYVIRFAESDDGEQWSTKEGVCIDFKDEYEFGFGRPWVIKEDTIYKMWYSIRSRREPYKLGYAESKDGKEWIRKDEEIHISRSQEGWDSEMICYPCVIDVKKKRYLFYNGNQHGSTGFGFAVWENK